MGNYGPGKTDITLNKFTLVCRTSQIWTMIMNSHKTTHGGKQAETNYYVSHQMNIAHTTTMVQVRQQVP